MKYKELMSNSFAQMTKSMPDMIREMSAAAIKENAKLSPAQKQAEIAKVETRIPEVVSALEAFFRDPTLADDMAAAIVPLYARYFTAAEIDQIIAFYQTPVGAKMITTMPQLMVESMQISQQIMMPRMQKLMARYVPTPAAK